MKSILSCVYKRLDEMNANLSRLHELIAHQSRLQTSQNSFLKDLKNICCDNYWIAHCLKNPHYQDCKKLQRHGLQVYSQNDEDGIISEIFNRVGENKRYFVEIGVEDGVESNTAYLLSKRWTGLWLEQSVEKAQRAKNLFAMHIDDSSLQIKTARVGAENINDLLSAAGVPRDVDLISIDIDGNDYHVWKAINGFDPRVVVVEYNAMFPPNESFVLRYDPSHKWSEDSNFGASLKALELLGRDKGYCLVGCNFFGVNAFFVRNDLVGSHFYEPFDAETHYEPPRYFLLTNRAHPKAPSAFDYFE